MLNAYKAKPCEKKISAQTIASILQEFPSYIKQIAVCGNGRRFPAELIKAYLYRIASYWKAVYPQSDLV